MSNHGRDNKELPEEIRKMFARCVMAPEDVRRLLYPQPGELGATGRFPMGKLTPEDEGEVKFALAADPKTKTIILDFGKPVAWIGMPRDDARKLAELILERIKELE